MKKLIRILLIEDNPEFRHAVELAFERTPDIELLYATGTAERAMGWLKSRIESELPDVILLDLTLLGMSGLEALPLLRDLLPDIKIITLTQSDQEADVVKAMYLGANGYLLKSSDLSDIKTSIRQVMEGDAPLDPRVARHLLKVFQENTVPPVLNEDSLLTERETEILQLLAEGRVKKEIAADLNISAHTVSNHVRHIYEKLKVPNAPAAITWGFNSGILRPSKENRELNP